MQLSKLAHETDFENMTAEYNARLEDLEDTRLRADDQISKLSSELGQCQTDINIALIEAQKYES